MKKGQPSGKLLRFMIVYCIACIVFLVGVQALHCVRSKPSPVRSDVSTKRRP